MKKKGSSKSHLRNSRIKQNTSGSIKGCPKTFGGSQNRSLSSSNKDVLINSSGLRSSANDIMQMDYVDEQQKENFNARQKSYTHSSKIQNSSSAQSKKISTQKRRASKMSWDQMACSDASAPQEWLLGSEKVSQMHQSVIKPPNNNESQHSMQHFMRQQSSTFDENAKPKITSSHKLLLTNPVNNVGAVQSNQKHQVQQSAAHAYQNQQPTNKDMPCSAKLKKQSSLKKIASQSAHQPISYTKVFVMGDTKFGQLGFLNPNEHNLSLGEEERLSPLIARPKMCSYNILIKQIACGEAQTHLLSQDGYVYSMGSNEYGVLGLGQSEHVLKTVTQPQLVPGLQCVIQIAAGRAHSIAMDVMREVYAWGRSDNGAIGLRMATPEHQSHPMPISLNLDSQDQVIQIDCGLEHSCFLTADGHVFGCGEGEYGQLGVGYVSLKEYRPIRAKIRDMPAGDYVTKIACGAHHTVYLTRSKQVYASGSNNFGELGIDSLETQVNSPTLIESLSNKSVQEVACGESSFAITSTGELYVWGLYNLEIYRKPFLPAGISRPVTSISQSFYGVTAAVDADEQAWYWHNQLEAQTSNLMKLPAFPTVMRQMKRRQVKKVFAGKDLVFALGDDVNNTSTSNLKDSEASSGLQEIPERDEQKMSGTTSNNQKMPTLNLSKIHKGSTGSLKKQVSSVEKAVSSISKERTQAKSRSQTPSRSRSRSRSINNKLSDKKIVLIRQIGSRSGSNQIKATQKVQQAQSRSPSGPPKQHKKILRQQHSSGKKKQQKRRKSGVRSASQHDSEAKPHHQRIMSHTKSGGSVSQPRTRSGSQQKNSKVIRLANKAHNATQLSLKSSKSAGNHRTNKAKKATNLEKQVARKFQDLSQRLETDKEEVVTRLAQLSQKVSKIQKNTSGKLSKKQKKVRQNQHNDGSHIMVQEQFSHASDMRSGSYDLQSDNAAKTQHQSQVGLGIEEQRGSHQTFQAKNNRATTQFNMFNSELQDPELNSQFSKPQLFFSPNQDTVDIRSPKYQPEKLRVDVSDSPRANNKETRFEEPQQQNRYRSQSSNERLAQQNADLLSSNQHERLNRHQIAQHNQELENVAKNGVHTVQPSQPSSLGLPSMGAQPRSSIGQASFGNGVKSPPVRSPQNNSIPAPPVGYVAVRSPKYGNNSRSPPFKKQQTSYETQLINQLREQIDYLERQTGRLREEKVIEQVRANDYMNRYEEARKSTMQIDVSQEGTLRSLESQLRTSKLEKSDLQIRFTDAERRVRDLEEKVIQQGASKNKEQDYRNKLGQSHETLRLEKARSKDLQNQNDMLSKTLQILETTVETVKRDKELIEKENNRLKEYLEAKDLEVDINAYRHMVGPQAQQNLGLAAADEMDRRSRSLGMRGSQQGENDGSRNDDRDSIKSRNEAKYGSHTSLIDKHIERSQERTGEKRRASSQMSGTATAGNLLVGRGFHTEDDKYQVTIGGGLMEDYINNDASRNGDMAMAPADFSQSIDKQQQPEHYYTVTAPNTAALNHSINNNRVGSQFYTHESRETGRFVEPRQAINHHDFMGHRDGKRDEKLIHIEEEMQTSSRDPRIQRLLEDARELQQKHKTLMATSPLRLKQVSAERRDMSRNDSHGHTNNVQSSTHEGSERAKQQNYLRLSQQSIQNPPPQYVPDRSSSPAYERHDRSPLRRKSHHIRAVNDSSPLPEYPSHMTQSMMVPNDDRPVSQELLNNSVLSGSAIRPYYEPPSQSENQSQAEPIMTAPPSQHKAAPIQELSPDFEDDDGRSEEEQEEPFVPVRGDCGPDEIRQRAGIKPSAPSSSSNQGQKKPTNSIKDLVRSAHQPLKKPEDRHPHFPYEPSTGPDDEDLKLGPQSRSQGPVPRAKKPHDNRDYIAAVVKDLDNNQTGQPRQPSTGYPVDKQKLEDQYNQKLLDNIEKLAERAKQPQPRKDSTEPKEARINKFKRVKSDTSQKENSLPDSIKSGAQPLPAAIFCAHKPTDDNISQDAYQSKLRQLNKRNGAQSAENPGRRQPSESSANPRRPHQRRPLSKEEDEQETQAMLAETKKTAPWTNGLNNQKNNLSVEKDKSTAQNNSFLARREALQNRLKKL